MSKFTSVLINRISPYAPGEQLRERKYIKLNTNENPYYTSPEAVKIINESTLKNLNRYSDPECTELTKTIADYYGVESGNVLVTNGSDEAIAFAFYAYGQCGLQYPDVTYGFYDVLAQLFDLNVKHVPLNDDFTVDIKKYENCGKTVVLANPNAQTGIELNKSSVESLIKNNLDNVVILDQAYVDFGNFNAVELIKKYKNLLVINTFSKSRSLAGARVGFVVADSALIDDLKKVKNSFHPYNVNSVSSALAAQALKDDEYFHITVNKIKKTRDKLAEELKLLHCSVLPSAANFLMVKSAALGGSDLYSKLKDNGILVRHFSDSRINDYVRISIGTDEETVILVDRLKKILRENGNESFGN